MHKNKNRNMIMITITITIINMKNRKSTLYGKGITFYVRKVFAKPETYLATKIHNILFERAAFHL